MHRGFIGTRLTLITQKQECCAYLLLTSFHPTLRPDARSRRWRMEPSGVHDNWIMVGFFGRHATNLVHYQKQLVLAEHGPGERAAAFARRLAALTGTLRLRAHDERYRGALRLLRMRLA
jgi:hypothetical protein